LKCSLRSNQEKKKKGVLLTLFIKFIHVLTGLRTHRYHLVDISPHPYLVSLSTFILLFGFVCWFNFVPYAFYLIVLPRAILILKCTITWWRDVCRESTYICLHTFEVIARLRSGILLFIFSEVIFFSRFFWSFFNNSLCTEIQSGLSWPPVGLDVLDTFSVPLLNTVILLSSRVTVTWCHHSVVVGYFYESVLGLLFTLILGVLFTLLQVLEYFETSYTISYRNYGSIFFIATGFHGFHVLVGSLFLLVGFVRLILGQLSTTQHIGLECAIWYWHFVDVVWVFLYFIVYWW
jgi:heme/copper-type cytochrome/quinol oxidase subunit 3